MEDQSFLTYNIASLIGIPFAYGGRGPDTFDCWGLVRHLHREVHGVEIPDYDSPTNLASIAQAVEGGLTLWREIESRPGAVILMRIRGLRAHVGFQLDSYRFIHTWEKSG